MKESRIFGNRMITAFPFPGLIFKGTHQDPKPNFYIYEVEHKEKFSRGLICSIPIEGITNGSLLVHEKTFDNHIASLQKLILRDRVQHNPILLITEDENLSKIILELSEHTEFLNDYQHTNGDIHRLYRICTKTPFIDLPNPFCIADGHHRCEAMLNYHKSKNNCLNSVRIMAGIFSFSYVRTRSKGVLIANFKFNHDQLFEKLNALFFLKLTSEPTIPTHFLDFRMCFRDSWYDLTLKPHMFKKQDHDRLLSIEIFKNFVLNEIFSINCYSNEPSIKVIFDPCNLTSIKNYLKDSMIGFVIPSDPLEKVMEAAKAFRTLPPNSTYFEPKFIEGMIGYNLL